MAHIALYRKYRSQSFDELIGQDHVIRTLQNALSTGRNHHAYLFTGPRGTGKTSTARLVAKALNCVNGPTPSPCGECHICISIAEGSCMDVVEMDAASEAGVDDVRQTIVEVVEYKPAICRFKVFIIDEVHDLSTKAFDALLKTIEEPPSHVVFVLATTELHKVPPTIQSRCQKFSFSRAKLSDLQARLTFVLQQEGREYEDSAVSAIARMADGGFRDALSLLEQALLTTDSVLTQEHVYNQLGIIKEENIDQLLTAIINKDTAKILDIVDDIYHSGREAKAILEAMMRRMSDLTRVAFSREIGPGSDASIEASMKATAAEIGANNLLELRDMVARAMSEMREVTLPKLWLESRLMSFGIVKSSPKQAPAMQQRESSANEKPFATKDVQKPVAHGAVQISQESPAFELPKAKAPEPAVVIHTESPEEIAWAKTVTAIGSKSKAAFIKIAKTRLIKAENGVATIEFDRQMDRDWVQEKAGLMPLLTTEFATLLGGNWRLELTVLISDASSDELFSMAPAVELPLEGQRLNEAIKKEFEGF